MREEKGLCGVQASWLARRPAPELESLNPGLVPVNEKKSDAKAAETRPPACLNT